MQRVSFIPPVSSSDLRVVLSNVSARDHDTYGIAYKTQFGETRVVSWLTEAEANRRAVALKARGYVVVVGPMDI